MTSSSLICIVDDDADYRLMIQLFFKQSCPQHPIRLFASGQALLDTLPQLNQRPDLILLDRHMPVLDGHMTLERLKRHPIYKRIPVVMMSALASKQEIEDCYDAGANSFLIKELDPILLQVSLSTLCQYWLQLNQLPTLA